MTRYANSMTPMEEHYSDYNISMEDIYAAEAEYDWWDQMCPDWRLEEQRAALLDALFDRN